MSLRVNNNIAALNAYRNLSATDNTMGKSLEKLSSGFRINRAGDDASGLVISEKLRGQVGGLKVAMRNAQDGVSVVQTAEGALTEVHAMLQRMRDLAVQATNTGATGDASTSKAVKAADDERAQLTEAIDDIANNTKFNDQQLLKSAGTLTFQVGANEGETLDVETRDMSSTGLAIDSLDFTAGADAAITTIDDAIDTVSEYRGILGASQNRLEHTLANISVTAENLSASESRIRDTDMAAEMTQFTRAQILTQAGTAMLAQANSMPQQVLQLLRG